MSNSPPAAIDDRLLEKLSHEPERPLAPLLSQAEAMAPLVIVLAFLPALYAVENRTLSEAGAWEGLVSLRCLAADSLSEFVDPAAITPAHPFRYQPPLMSWMTALSMRAFGVGHLAGMVTPAYLCTAGLIVAGYVLGRRMGGERLGLVTSVLLAFNPQILSGAQEPVPQSAAVMFAVLSLAGAIAHWQKSSAVTSYQLLLGGIALGLCLLAGGPVALAVVAVVFIYVGWWKADAWLRRRSGGVWERSQFNRRTALRSLAVLAATAFAVGGWNSLLMSSRYGHEFWRGWLYSGEAGPASLGARAGWSWSFVGVVELNKLVVPLVGLALAGLFGILRDLHRAEEDPARQHRGLVVVWTGVALLAWLASGGARDSGAPAVRVWETLLTVPLILAAALGLLDIAERRINFFMSLSIAFFTFADAIVVAGPVLAAAPAANALPGLVGNGQSAPDPVFGSVVWPVAWAVLAVGGTALARFAGRHDARRRVVLTGTLLAVVAANCVWGGVAVRRTNGGDRELDEIRSGLARLNRVAECTFVALAPATASGLSQPPAQLVYVLGSMWPDAESRYARSWDEAAGEKVSGQGRGDGATSVFVAWSPRGRVRPAAPAADLKSAAPPFLYRDFEVIVYVRDRSLRTAVAEGD